MTWLSKLERKYGKYAVPNLTLYLIIFYAVGYVLQMVSNGMITQYLTLDFYQIFHGQIWRLVTWILIPPESLDFFTLIMLYFYYSIGTSVERAWGTFRYNVYLISGMLFTVVGALLLFIICVLSGVNGDMALSAFGSIGAGIGGSSAEALEFFYQYISMQFSTYYVCLSITLAFAMTYPEVRVYIMFILPIKIKVLGIIYAILLGVQFLTSFMSMISYFGSGDIGVRLWGYFSAASCVAIFFSTLSAIIFFVTTRKSFRSPGQIKRQKEFKKKMTSAPPVSKHKCAICGRTSDEYPELEFRFCSKCDGNYEYCSDHLFTHKHEKPIYKEYQHE